MQTHHIPADALRAGPTSYTYFYTEARHGQPGFSLWRRPVYAVRGATLYGDATCIWHYATREEAHNAVRRFDSAIRTVEDVAREQELALA